VSVVTLSKCNKVDDDARTTTKTFNKHTTLAVSRREYGRGDINFMDLFFEATLSTE